MSFFLTIFVMFFSEGGLSSPSQSSGTSQNTGVIVGLSLLLIVLLLVVFKMYKNYQRVKTCSSDHCENMLLSFVSAYFSHPDFF